MSMTLFYRNMALIGSQIYDSFINSPESIKSQRNIERSIKRNRPIQILFVYQQPEQAWKFAQAREKVEGRKVLPEKFVAQYFSSRETVNRLKIEFGDRITVDLLIKNLDGTPRQYHSNVLKSRLTI